MDFITDHLVGLEITLGVLALLVLMAIVVSLFPAPPARRPGNRRRHRLCQRLMRSGQLRRME